VLIEVLLAAVLAQAPAAEPPKPPAPLTQVETLAIENIELKAQLVEALKQADTCRAEIGPLRSQSNTAMLNDQASKLKAAIESTRPGFSWDWQKKAFVPKPAPKPAAAKPASPLVEKP
jgi:hypothetical protein